MRLSNIDKDIVPGLDSKSRSILGELTQYVEAKSTIDVLESRASHVIQAAINLMNDIEKLCDEDDAEYLEKKLYNSIKSRDASKFTRMIRKLKKDD